MTLRHLRIFVAVCQHQSITRAAEALYLAQPAVSLAIRELEEYYGIRLFDRISRRLYLTESGKQFLKVAVHITELVNSMETSIRNWDRLGTIRIGSSVTIGNTLLPDYIHQFQTSHPQAEVIVIIENSQALESLILQNELDLALIEGTLHHNELHAIPFASDELILICGPTHPFAAHKQITIEQLRHQKFILREQGSAGRELFESLLQLHEIPIEQIGHSISTQALLKFVANGFALSVVPRSLAKQQLESHEILEINLCDAALQRSFSLIHHQNKFIPPLLEHFIDLVIPKKRQE